jgi:hypothetical protein
MEWEHTPISAHRCKAELAVVTKTECSTMSARRMKLPKKRSISHLGFT